MPLNRRSAAEPKPADGPSLAQIGRAAALISTLPAHASGAAMNALRAASAEARDARTAARRQLRTHLDAFARIAAALRAGDTDLGLSDADAAAVCGSLFPNPKDIDTLNAFVAHGYFVDAQLGGPSAPTANEAEALADLAATDLEQTLATALAEVQRLQNAATSAQTARAQNTQNLIRETLDDLKDLTLRIQLISVNASVEAARAGAAGAGFGVIAQEIKALSSAAESSVDKILSGVGSEADQPSRRAS